MKDASEAAYSQCFTCHHYLFLGSGLLGGDIGLWGLANQVSMLHSHPMTWSQRPPSVAEWKLRSVLCWLAGLPVLLVCVAHQIQLDSLRLPIVKQLLSKMPCSVCPHVGSIA